MLTVIFQFIRWVFEKFAVGVLIVGLPDQAFFH